ncbi:MAG: STM4011 family radical SAM protein [Alphaproteobacteria bacterium]|nr:STM4011 family radical SAM protein [Alphaproteobacteria bacterium]
MSDPLRILWRGPLSSCNYDCGYCPFAKTTASAEEIAADAAALECFVAWARGFTARPLGVLLTPWGEALHWPHVQRGLAALSQLPHVERVAIQTNLASRLDWLETADPATLAFWTTWHPEQVSMDRFVSQCARLSAAGFRYSVGVVGLKGHLDAAEALRAALPAHVYVWINAYKRLADYYTAQDLDRIEAIDPLFEHNRQPWPSLGRPCRAGDSVISVDGDGRVRRCHFVDEVLGNLYDPDFQRVLQPRRCPNAECRCHIGYVHAPGTGLYGIFEGGILERIPRSPCSR